MIDFASVTTSLFGLVGWNQPPAGVEGFYPLESDLVASSSGLTYHRHPYLTSENVQAIAPDYLESYVTDEERQLAYNAWLRTETQEGIRQAVTKWWTMKVQANTARTLMASQRAYWYEGPQTFGTTQHARVGFLIKPLAGLTKMLRIRISEIGVMFSSPGTVRIHFQAENETTPFAFRDLVYTGNGAEENFKLPTPVDFRTDGYRGVFVYYETANTPGSYPTYRGSCNCRMSSRYVSMTGFTHPDQSGVIRAAPTRENFGLNASIEIGCDYTQFIIDQAPVLAPLISLQVAERLLRTMAANPNARLNRNEGMADPDRILYQLDGDPQGRPTALSAELKAAYDAASFDREQVEDHCLPCNEQKGIKRMKNG